MTWTDEEREWVIAMFNGGASAAAIARELGNGTTRSAIIGLIDRARSRGVAIRTKEPSRTRIFRLPGPHAKATRTPPVKVRDLPSPEARRQEDGRFVGTLDLKPADCRWPHGEVGAEDFHYCANAKSAGSPYCEFHAARAIARNEKKEAA